MLYGRATVSRWLPEEFAGMGIVDPALIALLQNFSQAHGPHGATVATIGTVLVDSLSRSMMLVGPRAGQVLAS